MQKNTVAHIQNMKEIQEMLLRFIESDTDENDNLVDLISLLIDQNQIKNQFEFKMFLHILLQISNDHHHGHNFYQKIEKILFYCKQAIKQTFSNFDIFLFFKKNQKIILFLIEEKIIIFDDLIASYMINSDKSEKYLSFFYPEIQRFTPYFYNKFLSKFTQIKSEINTHEKLRKIGENESYICTLIRNDSVIEFIAFVNQMNISLVNTKISPSLYETNNFLKNKTLTIIEYAVFFGSIQIIKYLQFNNIELEPSLLIYAIHSNCPEVIHLIESENCINEIDKDQLFENCLYEAIKCHHNDIANYIMNELMNESILKNKKFEIIYYNYMLMNNDISYYNLNYYIKYDYFIFVDFILNNFSIQDGIGNFGINLLYTSNEILQLILSKFQWTFNTLLFTNFKKIKQISLPNSIKCIEENAFSGCITLQQIYIPNSIESIKNNAFYKCISLEQIEIPSSVKSIGKYAFYYCLSLKEFTIPSSISIIEYYTFGKCISLFKIKIPFSVITIDEYAFDGCSSLKELLLPNSIKSIKYNAFNECTSLTQVTIPSSVISIDRCVFRKCSSLEYISIPYYLHFFRYYELEGCSSLKYISIPSSVTSIDNKAFIDCISLVEIFIPSSVKKICESSFKNCTSLKKIEFEFGSSLETIKGFAFCKCSSLKEIIIPSSVTNIGIYAFYKCISLTKVSFETPSLINSIEEGVFAECFSLSEISIPSSVTIIEKEAFKLCFSISYIMIPASVVKIEKFAFFGCLSLLRISIPYSINYSDLGLENNDIIIRYTK